ISHTPFGDSDFLLFEEADAFLALEDDPNSPKIKPFYYDPERDILLLKAILNSEALPPLPNHEQYMPSFKKEPKVCEAKTVKSSVDEPPEILMEEDYKPVVQHQRRVNTKIHDVIKKEVEKLLDAGLIYPIFDSPWVSPVHCLPKKGGFTVVENEENELIPTRLVTRWWVCIDYRKLNEATRKDHFPLPFMDQMLERLAGNEYYCFLDGFSRQWKSLRTTSRSLRILLKPPLSVRQNASKISKNEIEVDKAKVDVIAKLPHPTTVKGNVSRGVRIRKIPVISHHEQKHNAYGSFRPQVSLCQKGCQGEIAPVGSTPPRI
nr:reverse transcriptase domain-containing protein [Tanacetum cinerariifolium]